VHHLADQYADSQSASKNPRVGQFLG
jgi:hypothetical protein